MAFVTIFYLVGTLLYQASCYPDVARPYEVSTNRSSKIDITTAPYIASLRSFVNGVSVHKCGASIIEEQFLLTAAHCMDVTPPISHVLVGTDNVYSDDGDLFEIALQRIHEDFDRNTMEYDVGLIKLTKPLTFGLKVNKVYLADYDLDNMYSYFELNATGWGYCGEPRKDSAVLLQVVKPMIDDKTCNAIYGLIHKNITSRMMCAGNVDEESVCELGETGGPLTTNDVQFGIKSFTLCPGKFIEVYTKVSSVLCWIMKQIVLLK